VNSSGVTRTYSDIFKKIRTSRILTWKYVGEEFERISGNYVDFLSRTRTVESDDEKSTKLKFGDHVMRKATNNLYQRKQSVQDGQS
jgi:hypothetical protein